MGVVQKAKGKINSLAARFYLASPKIVQCNICQWEGKHFLGTHWHPYTVCPNCGSAVRHRLLFAALNLKQFSFNNLVAGKKILHFAPENILSTKFKNAAAKYITADLLRSGSEMKLDIANMSSFPDNTFDLLVACDVLEHVPDHIKAMQEIHRILSPGGYAILTVPQKDHLATTFEDPSIVDPKEREKIFGQADHLRIYGDDFPQILTQAAGFTVTVVNESEFAEELVKKHVLFPPVLSTDPLATNYRKIFIAHKS
ncbi:MAG TPA: class I SAM-dependent methyltransferase [Oscillatoriaceae cyanobacterium M33_DOE_052]|uniref:Class I SAM-dependent methyltransferase n=1 Tax=Planktothricoides sp. SpSt-374 TaxID=2282167 RepID=A0A7C3ZJD1_9CYAN|nr:class I SAM-dependent methyltransferase [Oscillatoriaceae cyanobacterium M33_DOE_052]